jgi:hypothetical protein
MFPQGRWFEMRAPVTATPTEPQHTGATPAKTATPPQSANSLGR